MLVQTSRELIMLANFGDFFCHWIMTLVAVERLATYSEVNFRNGTKPFSTSPSFCLESLQIDRITKLLTHHNNTAWNTPSNSTVFSTVQPFTLHPHMWQVESQWISVKFEVGILYKCVVLTFIYLKALLPNTFLTNGQ